MSALDEISGLLDSLKFRKEELARFEGLLSEVSVALSDICAAMEKPEKDDQVIADALILGLRNISPPTVNVNVPQAQIVIMPAEEKEEKSTGWKLLITSRDGNGNIREISFKPEN